MSNGAAIVSLPAFLKRVKRPAEADVIDVTPSIPPDKDLEVLAQTISILRNRKVIADGDVMKCELRTREAEMRAGEAEKELHEAIDAYEAEVRDRGLLCRK